MQPYNNSDDNSLQASAWTPRNPGNRVPPPPPRPIFPPNPGSGNNNHNRPSGGGSAPGQMPLSPPPSTTPRRNPNTRAVDPGSIRNCMGRFTYVWMDNGMEFWMFPIQIGRRSVSGFRWNSNFGWVYFGVSLDRIDSFTCV